MMNSSLRMLEAPSNISIDEGDHEYTFAHYTNETEVGGITIPTSNRGRYKRHSVNTRIHRHGKKTGNGIENGEEIISPTSSSSNGSNVDEDTTKYRGEEEDDNLMFVRLSSEGSYSSTPNLNRSSRSSLSIGIPGSLTPTLAPLSNRTRRTSSSFSDLGDCEELQQFRNMSVEGVSASDSDKGGTPIMTNSAPFYPIHEDEAFNLVPESQSESFIESYELCTSVGSRSSIDGGRYHNFGSVRRVPQSMVGPQIGPQMYGSNRYMYHSSSSNVMHETLDLSQPLAGNIYPVAGEILQLKVEHTSYIIFYKDDDTGDVCGTNEMDDLTIISPQSVRSTSTLDGHTENIDFSSSRFMSSSPQMCGSIPSVRPPPRSLKYLDAAGHKVQTVNCFTRDPAHPTVSIGRGLFRASTNVGNGFWKGAAGLVHQSYEGGANGGVMGFAKGFGMGMLGLGTHTVKGAVRGVGEMTTLVGEMVLGTAPHFSIDGMLVLTNYRIIWMPAQSTEDVMEIPLASITAIDSSTTAAHVINIECKGLLRASFAFPDGEICSDFLNSIWEHYGQGPYIFAHIHYQALQLQKGIQDKSIETPLHAFYKPEIDYSRLGLLTNSSGLRLYENTSYCLFPTYPSAFIIPANMSDEELRELAAYRSASRIPAVNWKHPTSKALMCRCAQPQAGLSGYVASSDQKYIATLQQLQQSYHWSSRTLHFYDARSQIAATANSAKGKGTEDPRNYPNSELHFARIANIHAVRSSFSALSSLCQPGQDHTVTEWQVRARSTMWFGHLCRILETAKEICEVLGQGESVVVHCSDGWDRTPQLTSLVQLLLDPYYRTLRGFMMLIEKEWVSFGHMFRSRYSHGEAPGKQEVEDQSPVFVQWLDTVWQIWRQQQWAFEFNEALLSCLYEHVFSGLYGNFLYNCEKERQLKESVKSTRSIWHALLEQEQKYVNCEYDSAKNVNSNGVILPFSAEEDDLVIWETHLIFADPVCRRYQA